MFRDYQVDENYGSGFKEGEFYGVIKEVVQKQSFKGNDMLVVTVEIEGQGSLRYFLVDDVSSEEAYIRRNQNLTRFFDCFKIRRGNFDTRQWIGARGLVRIAKGEPNENGRQYFEIKSLLVEQRQNNQQGNQNNQSGTGGGYGNANRSQQRPQQQGYGQPSAYQGGGGNYNGHQNYDDRGNGELDNIPF